MQDPRRLSGRTTHPTNGPACDRAQEEHGVGAWIPRDCASTTSTLTRRVQRTTFPGRRMTARTRGRVRRLWRLGCAWARVSACFRAASLVRAMLGRAAAVPWPAVETDWVAWAVAARGAVTAAVPAGSLA